MKTYFHIENKEFTDYLKVTVQEKEYYFCDNLTIEYDDSDTLNVNIKASFLMQLLLDINLSQ